METFVIFATEGERFGVPAAHVAEVLDAPQLRHLGGMPEHVAGVLYHRGQWLPAIDAAPRLGLPARERRAAALVIKRGPGHYALTADAVLGIRSWTTNQGDVVTTDLGIVTPVDPNALFRSELPHASEEMMTAATEAISLVVFQMNGEEFATDIKSVVEVLEHREPVHVPHSPDFVEGVVHLRDAVLPIVDLRKRLEIPLRAATADTRIIVVLIDGQRVGLLVDSVLEVAHVPADQISAPPAFFRGLAAEYLQGLAVVNERLLIVLRLDRILNSQERIALLQADLVPESTAEPVEQPKGRKKKK